MRSRARDYAAVLGLLSAGCHRAEGPPPPAAANTSAAPAAATTSATPATGASDPAASPSFLDTVAGAFGRGRGLPLPEGLVPGGDCPPAPSDAAQEIAAQAEATVPLTEGLTFTYLWTVSDREYECLTQVTKIDGRGIETTLSCDYAPRRGPFLRRVCRSDLRSARMMHTVYGTVKVINASGQDEPETITGATAFSLSSDQFRELKKTGVITHHYVELAPTGRQLDKEGIGEMRLEGREMRSIVVNDGVVDVPVIKARGTTKYWVRGQYLEPPDTLIILDDERFPLLIESLATTDAAELGIRFARITYPSHKRGVGDSGGGPLQFGSGSRGSSLEKGLLENERVDVYGIYFDFNSDRIRPESEPVLEEIGSIMKRHPEWRLNVQGHTDNVGGNGPANLELSRRRSAAVQSALVTRFGISADRLTSGGSGAASPKDTNDTPEGRARNRRVELVRQ